MSNPPYKVSIYTDTYIQVIYTFIQVLFNTGTYSCEVVCAAQR